MPVTALKKSKSSKWESLLVDVRDTAKTLGLLKNTLIEESDSFTPETIVVTLRLDRDRDELFKRHEAHIGADDFIEEIRRSALSMGINLRSRLCQYPGFDPEQDFLLLPYIHRAVFTIEREALVDLISSSKDLEWVLADAARNVAIGLHDEDENRSAKRKIYGERREHSRMLTTTDIVDDVRISTLRGLTDGAGQVIGVLDTGIDSRHSVLSGKCVAFGDFDGAGRPRPHTVPTEYGCHGTKVCSLMVGDLVHGHTSVAPGAKVAVARVLGGGLFQPTATLAQITAGASWLIHEKANGKQNISVANASLQFFNAADPSLPTTKAVLSDLKNFAQIQPVLAVGNHRRSVLADAGLSVGAMSASGATAAASTFSASDPDILARGEQLRCAQPPLALLGFRSFGTYNGTSLAVPAVSGVLALLVAATGRPIDDCVNAILQAAKQRSGQSTRNKSNGWGPLDGDLALQILTGTQGSISAP